MKVRHVAPEAPAVDVADAAEHARVWEADETDALAALALTATLELEAQASLALLTRTVELRLTGWPASGKIRLPIGPVQDGATATVTANGEPVIGAELLPGRHGELRLEAETAALLSEAEIVITYPAGYGATPGDVPADLRHAILDQVAALYDARGAADPRRMTAAPAFLRIAARHRGARV